MPNDISGKNLPGTCSRHNRELQVKLIVTADDLGIAPERDLGIFAAYEHGIVTNASLLVNGCSAREAGNYPVPHDL